LPGQEIDPRCIGIYTLFVISYNKFGLQNIGARWRTAAEVTQRDGSGSVGRRQGGDRITAAERRAALSLGSIFGLRMIGLFMILPVFSLYAHRLEGYSPALMGVAIGAYGLTQAIFQIPFGLLSDRLGRKRIIYVGLAIFALGGVVAAQSDSIYGVIAGRALQGTGAIAAAVMALLADLTRHRVRTKAMAILGGSVGMSFTVALVLGPALNDSIGVPGIFWLTALLALLAIGVTRFVVPDPVESHFHVDSEPVPSQVSRVITDPQLLRLDFGVFTLHVLITANFVVLPLLLRDTLQLPSPHHWWLYLPVLLLSVVAMLPIIFVAERRNLVKPVFLGAILLMGVAETGLLVLHQQIYQVATLLFIFFTGFNLMEATLPSLISRMAPPESKGTAMGIFSSSQFLGAFVGGAAGGWLLGIFDIGAVFAGCASMTLLWFAVASGMQTPEAAEAPRPSAGMMADEVLEE